MSGVIIKKILLLPTLVKNTISMENKNKNSWLTTFLILFLAVLFIITGYLYLTERNKNKHLTVQLVRNTEEKDSLTVEFDHLLVQYQDLQTSNDSINKLLGREQEKIKRYIAEIKSLKTANKEVIDQYKRELETLRKIMRGFIHQIDSLNTLNQNLTAENIQVKTKFKAEQKRTKELTQKYDSASNLVAKAAVVKSENIVLKALNRKGKEVTKIKKVEKFSVCFTLNENVITKRGLRNVYIRISRPDELVLLENEANLFNFEGQEIAYSAMREVDYQGQDLQTCIYYDHNPDEQLLPGTYIADIFMDGKMIGTTTLTLK